MRKRQRGLIVLGLVMLAAALGLTVFNLIAEMRASISVDFALEQLRPKMFGSTAVTEQTKVEPQRTADEVRDAAQTEIPDHILAPEWEMPAASVDGLEYIGVLSLPKLSLELPILSESDDARLKIAPCRYYGSAYTDDMVISGHNYRQHFGRLHELSIGDSVRFTDMDGNVFSYTVIEVESLEPDETERMVTGDWDLTMFTCTAGRQHRLTVRCERTEK